ncbi:Ig-like domain-containing protein [Arthrobacter sp. QXT-31]|uniref:Ig-like domain-containing protein n=1 Tax=Arthrobacter sp. QXT-31 TaxID=1357915 RepID=UPI0012FC3883|nr:Ig-like domain-containing protein [Arthrobacter sp. QXT-31]
MPLRLWTHAKQRALASATTFSAVGLLVAAAAIHPGFKETHVDLNDGGVWVTNSELNLVGHLNFQSKTLDGGLMAASSDFDILQHSSSVLVADRGNASLGRVRVSTVTLEPPQQLPGAAVPAFGEKAVAVADPASGSLWVTESSMLGSIDFASQEPAVSDAQGIVATVGVDDVVHAADPARGEVTTLRVDATGGVDSRDSVQYAQIRNKENLQVAAVGDKPVVFDAEGGSLHLPGGRVTQVPDAAGAQLQQSGPASDFVAAATEKGLIRQPLDGSAATVVDAGTTGTPATPVHVNGCVYAAWSGQGKYLRECTNPADNSRADIPGVSARSQLVFRVNRDIVVLNDVTSGNVWLVTENMRLVANWDEIIPPPDKTEDQDDPAADDNPVDTLPDRTKENRPPSAVDDQFGVRPGRTTVLPILDNDSDPDGDVLTVQLQGDNPAAGTVQSVYNGTGLQVKVPADATGTSRFQYQASDGRGGTAGATVSLTVKDAASNEPPKQRRVPTIILEQGKSISQNVLTDWRDPDGDDLLLLGARSTREGDQVRTRADGLLTFQDVGSALGKKDVAIIVSDGRDQVEGTVVVEVRAKGDLPPKANADHVAGTAGQDILVSPLKNDSDPTGEGLRLTRVAGPPGQEITPDYRTGTFTFRAANPGTYYATYLVTNGPHSSEGLVRMDVKAAAAGSGGPVAVADVALLPAGGEVLVDALANDSDPAGGVLVIQSVGLPRNSAVAVAVVNHQILRITDVRGLTAPTSLTYTVSNGVASSTGEVTILPIPAPAKLVPPVAAPDEITVRANDVATIAVLANDSHPNGAKLKLKPVLVQGIDSAQGFLAVSGDVLRFKAGNAGGTVHAIYAVSGPDGQEDSAQVTIHIRAAGANSRPLPQHVTGRVVAGNTTRIVIPLDGIDPDGDSVTLVGLEQAPRKGTAVVGAHYVEYTAPANASGQDTFSYVVEDRFGARSTARVSVGVAPAPGSNQSPVAVEDSITVLPGRHVSVDVLANDSDPDGDNVTLAANRLEAAPELKASVIDGRVQLTAPTPSGPTATAIVRYEISDRRGGTAVGTLKVHVRSDAATLAPIARDDRVTFAETLGKTVVEVPVLKNDEDPDGVAAELKITFPQAAPTASVSAPGKVTVRLESQPQIVAYTVTDMDKLSSTAFILVPGLDGQAPALKSTAPLEVVSGQQLTMNLQDLVVVRPGKSPRITQDSKVQAVASNGAPLVKDAATIVFTSADDYSGPAAVSLEVTDGASADDPDGRKAVLTIGITVLPDPARNHPPTFPSGSLDAAVGEEATLDLRQVASDVDEADQDRLTFALQGKIPAGIRAALDGSVFKATVDGAAKGSRITVPVTVTDGRSAPVKGAVDVRVVASNRPLAAANDDVIASARAGQSQRVQVLDNDVNPFPETPLKVLSAAVETGTGTAAVEGDTVTVSPAGDFVGTMVVRYRVQDKTQDAEREIDGRIRLTVKDKPDAPSTPTVGEVRDRTVVLNWSPPANNGAAITGYKVSGSGGFSQQCPATTCTLTGLTNNVEYTFTVVATNEVGDSAPSPASAPARPDAKPDTPAAPTLVFGDKSLTVNWVAPRSPGSPVESYNLEISPAPPGGNARASRVTGTSYRWTGLQNGTPYQVRIQASNKAPDPSEWSAYSASMIPAGIPGAPGKPATTRSTSGGADSIMLVSWAAAANNGASIDTYTVNAMQGGSTVASTTVSGSQLSVPVTVGNSATDYTFTVVAKNKAGTSAASPPSDPRRAFGTPGAVPGVRADPLDNAVQLSFGEAAGNGATPSYQYQVNGGGFTAVPADKVIRTGVPNNGNYTIGVRAVNSMDGATYEGPVTNSNPVAPYGKPHATSVNPVTVTTTVRFDVGAVVNNGRPVVALEYQSSDGKSGTLGAGGGSVTTGNGYDQTISITVTVVDDLGQRTAVSASGRTAPAKYLVVDNGTASPGTCEWPTNSTSAPDTAANCAAGGGTFVAQGTRVQVQCVTTGASYTIYDGATGRPTGTTSNVWYKVINDLWIRPTDGPVDSGVPAC